jgi:hypothetical protein
MAGVEEMNPILGKSGVSMNRPCGNELLLTMKNFSATEAPVSPEPSANS